MASGEDTTADATAVQRFVRRHHWIDQLARAGWLSRGIVYAVFGLLAVPVAFQRAASDDQASPSGALGRIAEVPAGRLVLAILVVGMVLYVAFQLLSLALIDEHTLVAWWRRAGHLMATVLYATFAWSAARLVVAGAGSGGESLIERISRSVLVAPGGRLLVGAAGIVTIAVGGYFLFRHVVQRGFVDGLTELDSNPTENDVSGGSLVVLGLLGWTGRSIVVALIGFFLVRAAWTFDSSDARGFDRALREASGSGFGSALVLVAAVGLLLYGVFCVASHRHRTVHDNESDD